MSIAAKVRAWEQPKAAGRPGSRTVGQSPAMATCLVPDGP
jgi:hypothetical protein